MPQKSPQNHKLIWSDLLKDLDISSWWQIVSFLYYKEHGYSNYEKCLERNYDLTRNDVLNDNRIKQYISQNEENSKKVEAVLDEMCHLLPSQQNPTRKLKIAGTFFLKCITGIYSSIYVNNNLMPLSNGLKFEEDSFKKQYLEITKSLPVVILPTHRSYMDFLFISYIMTHFELPLPIVAAGDNFKAMGKFLLDYLKSTGAFVVRRAAHRKKDIEATAYYDILRAYVHSIIKGGENPLEFFMEGTRTRVGQVLRPKTGLLSMVVDTFIDKVVDDVYIMPVSINYQRPIEEQLYVGENTPQINMKKPKESALNLFSAFETIMKRKYGKVYVRFLEPFKLSEYFEQWKKVTGNEIHNGDREAIIHEFTNSLASKVCLAQASSNILMPFNLLSCSLLSRSFLQDTTNKTVKTNGYHNHGDNIHPANNQDGPKQILRVPIDKICDDFYLLEALLQKTQSQFVPGWESHLEIFEELKLDRDGIIRPTSDRRFIEFNNDATAFQTMLYYSNQLLQTLLPVAICFLLPETGTDTLSDQWDHYKKIRTLLLREFFSNESFMRQEFDEALAAIQANNISSSSKKIVVKLFCYFINSYLLFFDYLLNNELFDINEFFHQKVERPEVLYISKDMIKNMSSLVVDESICESIQPSKVKGETRSRPGDEKLRVINRSKVGQLRDEFQQVLKMSTDVINNQLIISDQ